MATYKWDGRDLPLVGPFGDKALHGSKLEYGYAKADESAKTEHPEWVFCAYVPANGEEAKKLTNAKPDMAVDLYTKALMTKARAQAWAEERGGSTTADVKVTFKGKTTYSPRTPLEMIETLRAAGMTVEVVPRIKKPKK